MRTTTIATIEAHSASCYCVLLCLCGCSIVWQHTAHLIVAVMGRGLSDRSVQMLNSFYPVARRSLALKLSPVSYAKASATEYGRSLWRRTQRQRAVRAVPSDNHILVTTVCPLSIAIEYAA